MRISKKGIFNIVVQMIIVVGTLTSLIGMMPMIESCVKAGMDRVSVFFTTAILFLCACHIILRSVIKIGLIVEKSKEQPFDRFFP